MFDLSLLFSFCCYPRRQIKKCQKNKQGMTESKTERQQDRERQRDTERQRETKRLREGQRVTESDRE